MNYYVIEPEVAGEIGDNTVYENNKASIGNNEIPQICHLHFVFSGWMGDEILESTPCFLVSEKMKSKIIKNKLSGCVFQEIEMSYSDEFIELYPNRKIPNFYRLIPVNTLYVEKNRYHIQKDMSDFMISQKYYLILSEKAKDIITISCTIKNADFTPLTLM